MKRLGFIFSPILLMVFCVGGYAQDAAKTTLTLPASAPIESPSVLATQKALDKKREGTYAVRKNDISTILSSLFNDTGIQFQVFDGSDIQVSLNLENPTVRDVLNTILPPNGLTYSITDTGVVKITKAPTTTSANLSVSSVGPTIKTEKVVTTTQVTSSVPVVITQTTSQPEKDNEWIAKTQKSIAIMSKIFDDVLKKELGDSYKSKGFFSEGCQGYWLPNEGVMFLLNVNFPLLKPEKKETKEEIKKGEKDLWDQYEDKLSGVDSSKEKNIQRSVDVLVKKLEKKGKEFDEDKVEKLRNTILEAIADYGHRFEGFQANDMFTVIVESPDAGDWANDLHINLQMDSDRKEPFYKFQYNALPAPPQPQPQPKPMRDQQMNDAKWPSTVSFDKNDKNVYEYVVSSNIIKSDDDKKNQEALQRIQEELHQIQEEMDKNKQEYKMITDQELESAKEHLEQVKKMVETGVAPVSNLKDAEMKLFELQKKITESRQEMFEKSRERLEKARDQYNQAIHKSRDLQIVNDMKPLLLGDYSELRNKTIMVIQVKFGEIPPKGGKAEDIKDKVKITIYPTLSSERNVSGNAWRFYQQVQP